MPTFNVNGITTFASERGTGIPLVLIHGFPLNGTMWSAQITALSDAYRVITPDLRGFGQTPSTDAFTMESLADDVHALLAQMNALPCILGGLSMGGYVALAYAKKFANDLRALMLIDTKAEGDSPD